VTSWFFRPGRAGLLAIAASALLSAPVAGQQAGLEQPAQAPDDQAPIVTAAREADAENRTGNRGSVGLFDRSPSALYPGTNTVFTVSFAVEPQGAVEKTPDPRDPAAGDTRHESRLHKLIDRARSLGSFTGSPTGFYPQVTTIYPGGSLAFGGGYKHAMGDNTAFDVDGAWSLQNFKKLEAVLSVPLVRGDSPWLTGSVEAGWMDAPEVAFYGIGNDSPDNETHFAYRPTTVGMNVSTVPWHHLRFGGGAHYVAIDAVTALEGPPEALDVLPVPVVLADAPRYLRSQAGVEYDWVSTDGYPHSGGRYRVSLEDHADRSGSQLSFRALEAELIQFVPIVHETLGLAFHGLATITDDGTGDRIPVYLMPSLGGNNSIRGYQSFRFRDSHRLLLTAETRWRALRFLEVALFYDAGKVASETDDLNLSGLRSSYGVGARVINVKRTVFRVEVARNDQQSWRMVWSTRASF
jgi:hypothetical protein